MGGKQVCALEVGQTVRVAPGVSVLRLGWDAEGEAAPSGGKIVAIDTDGCLNVRRNRPNRPNRPKQGRSFLLSMVTMNG